MTRAQQKKTSDWPASLHISTGCLALTCFVVFFEFWAGKDTVYGSVLTDGVLVSDAPQSGQGITVSADLPDLTVSTNAFIADAGFTGLSALLVLDAQSDPVASELSGEVLQITQNPRDTTVTIRLSVTAIQRVGGQVLDPGTPVSLTIQMPPRSPVAYLLDPLSAYFSPE